MYPRDAYPPDSVSGSPTPSEKVVQVVQLLRAAYPRALSQMVGGAFSGAAVVFGGAVVR
jgi:hypothetical protein